MEKAKIVAVLLYVFVTTPIWYYLLYTVLESVNASELTWFLYWVYVPVSLLSGIIINIVKD